MRLQSGGAGIRWLHRVALIEQRTATWEGGDIEMECANFLPQASNLGQLRPHRCTDGHLATLQRTSVQRLCDYWACLRGRSNMSV